MTRSGRCLHPELESNTIKEVSHAVLSNHDLGSRNLSNVNLLHCDVWSLKHCSPLDSFNVDNSVYQMAEQALRFSYRVSC